MPSNPWSLYQRPSGFVLGFHGSSKATIKKTIETPNQHLVSSCGKYEWLGHGIYFWENDPQRGIEWAMNGNSKKKYKDPGVVGAVIDLGHCLDLTTRIGLDEICAAYELLRDSYKESGYSLPQNDGGDDLFRRELDCQVIQALHQFREDQGLLPYDSVRAPFLEDKPLYEGAGFRLKNHIQIAVRKIDCIKGYFYPIKRENEP